VPFLAKNGYVCPSFHNPADFIMEVVCGEHGEAIPKLVKAVDEKSSQRNRDVATIEKANASTKDQESREFLVEDLESFTVKVKENSLGKCCMKRDKTVNQVEHHITFATPFKTQFWILLKRSFKTITRDKTLTEMRFISHITVGAIIGMIYYGIGNDAGEILFKF
jgi:acyl-CoA thioesterase